MDLFAHSPVLSINHIINPCAIRQNDCRQIPEVIITVLRCAIWASFGSQLAVVSIGIRIWPIGNKAVLGVIRAVVNA